MVYFQTDAVVHFVFHFLSFVVHSFIYDQKSQKLEI